MNKVAQALSGTTLAVGVACAVAPAAGIASDAVSLAIATGNSTQMLRVGTQWRWDRHWRLSDRVNVGGYWDLTLAQWHGTRYDNTTQSQNITDIGITPVFRWEDASRSGWYAEGGIGAHLLSAAYNNGGRQLSTAYEFGDHIGAGYVTKSGVDIGLLFQHFSNGGIKHPNNGVNFAMLRASYSF